MAVAVAHGCSVPHSWRWANAEARAERRDGRDADEGWECDAGEAVTETAR